MISSFESLYNTETLYAVIALLISGSFGIIRPLFLVANGYGISICTYGTTIMVLIYEYVKKAGWTHFSIVLFAQALLLAMYGIRLTSFVIIRSYNESFTKNRTKMEFPVHFPASIFMWLTIQFLYFCYGLPVLVGYLDMSKQMTCNLPMHFIGCIIMAIGFVCEALADHQKTKYKKINPDRFCDKGLYRLSRMPNYFGEATFWTGCFISFLGDSFSLVQLIFSILGILSTYGIMFGSSSRLDKKQFERYHNDPEYMKYRSTTPVMIPFIPVYSLLKSTKTD